MFESLTDHMLKDFLRQHMFFLLGGICIVIVGIIFIASRERPAEIIRDGDVIFDAVSETPPATEYIIIHIDGEVNYPGVFHLPANARVDDALTKAGGATVYANLDGINRADFLRDGMKILIPALGDEPADVFVFSDDTEPGIRNGTVNINTASAAELQILPGIGPARAESIIAFRETHGNFADIEELMNISGIGPGIMDRVRDRVTVR